MDQSSPRRANRSELRCVRALLRASSAAELLATLLTEGPAWITGEGSALYLLDGGVLRLIASHELPEWVHRKYGVIDPASGLPAALALRRREPVLLSPQQTSADYPNTAAGLGTGLVALAVLPLVVDGDPVGSLALALAHRGAVPRRDVELLETFADVVAHRLVHLPHPGHAADPTAAGLRERPPSAEGQLLSLAVRSAGAGAFERDLVTGETLWDAQAYRVVGRRPPGATGRAPDLADVVHPEDLPDVQAALAEALATGGPYRISYRVVRPDGSPWQVDEAGEVMLDVHRRPVRTAGLLTGREWRPGPAGVSAAAAGARSTLLLALTRALSRAVTVREVTTALTDVARPALGAAGVVLDLVDEGRLTPVSPAVYGGPHRAELNRLHDLAGGVMEHALARATPLFSEPGRERRGPDAPAAWTVLPLVASGRQVGSCLITFATERSFSREDRTMFSAFAGILAQSLERARLYDVHHERASELQRAMLPRSLPVLPGISSAARYLPSTEGMQIGGDWYDLLRLPDGLVGLVIGDVQGHNAEATAVMGQLRSVLWAYATEGNDPAAALERTSWLLSEMETELFATCVYVVLDPVTGALRAARAGHPQPVRIGAGGAAELELPGGPPLGVLPGVRYPLVEARLAPGETLLAYTDGLVEVRDEDYDESVQRMLGGLELWTAEAGGAGRLERPGALERLADLLTLNVTEREVRQDDVALLLLHRVSTDAEDR
ncbi:SpoIIE family protein phosphatase [Kitasatospora phosalacinea]|uniref:SpoIIE family protein phosphatase n=1 Tax=Kitasatospora phosalacinea TaxID=2065 RepID=UPI00068D1263|nr:SpoIIE family protein phosphatase [Kitasatospora phosalacinea]